MFLSIILPAYNESRKIASDILAAERFLMEHHFLGEILVVDDGSDDDTARVASEVRRASTLAVRVLRNEHRGKGYAVRTGVLHAQGEYILFADSGLPVPYANALRGLALLQRGACDIAHASRRLPGSLIRRPQPWSRRVFSRLFHWGSIWFMKIPARLSDTQCGFKIYRGEVARRLYAECFTEGFMFDLEIILRALHAGYRIHEFPVEWTCDRDSRLSIARSPWHILRELYKIKTTLARAFAASR